MFQKRFYVLPARFTHAAAATLLVSLLLNVLGILITLKGGSNTVAQKHIQPRAVALEVVDSDRYGLGDDNDWASLTPPGHGFVKIDNDFYALSMYHQIHCLNGFRRIFNSKHNTSHGGHEGLHSLHCLSYLRQMILCSADTTLEPAFLAINTDGRQTEAAYGTGVTHKCRDWVEVRKFAGNNYKLWEREGSNFVATEGSAVGKKVR